MLEVSIFVLNYLDRNTSQLGSDSEFDDGAWLISLECSLFKQ